MKDTMDTKDIEKKAVLEGRDLKKEAAAKRRQFWVYAGVALAVRPAP